MKLCSYLFILSITIACNRTESKPTQANDVEFSNIAQPHPKTLESLANKLWNEAYANKDADLAALLFAEQFILVDDEGSIFSRDDELAYIAEYGDQYKNFSFVIEQSYFSSKNTGVLIADCKFLNEDSTGLLETSYKQSLVYSHSDTLWKVTFSHVSGVKETRL